jgi:hypothetical protein
MLDYGLVIIGALTIAAQAILGLLVTTRPPPIIKRVRYEIAFVGIAVIGALAIVVGAIRGLDSQTALQDKVGALNKTEDAVLLSNNNMSSTINSMADDIRGLRSQIDAYAKAAIASASPPTTVPSAASELAHIKFVQRAIPSTDPAMPYASQVIIQTDATISNAAFAIACDNEIENGNFFVSGQGAMMNVQFGVTKNKKAFVFKFGFPAFAPDTPIVVTLHSKFPIHVLEVKDIRGQF